MKYKNLKEHEIPLKSMRKWISALRSGKFKQGKYRMLDHQSRYCCLGVCAKVLGFSTDHPCPTLEDHPEWLASISNRSCTWSSGREYSQRLTELNDTGDYTFDEIADILEFMFIHDMPEYGKEK